MKPIRVLQVLHILNRGGAEAMVMNLYRKIDKTRIQFDFLVHEKQKGLYEDEILSMGGRIYRVPAFKGYNLISYYSACMKLFKSHPEIMIVHGHLGSCAALYLKAAKECGKFTIAHSHSAGSLKNVQSLIYYIFSYPTRFIADQLFGCSTEAGLARYGDKYVKSPKYKNFNNAIDSSLFKFNEKERISCRNELNIPLDKIVIATVGRITYQKNPHRIYEIFKYIVNNYNNTICLWVGTGEMNEEIKKRILNDGLDKSIIMTGVRSDVSRLMSVSDCMLFPSFWEGLPVSVIESQAANLPAVLSDTISKETQISDLLCWHSLNDSDAEWAKDTMRLANEYWGRRNDYSFDMQTTGYDINETVKWLMDFYESKVI